MSPRSIVHRPGRLTCTASRAGFSLPEILIVIVLISVLALVAIPRFSNANAKRHMESARMRVASSVATARQAAIQKGQSVQFKIVGNRLTVTASSVNLISPVPLDTLYSVNASALTIDFSGRGFATNLSDQTTISLTRTGTYDDSVVVTKTGMVKQ